MNCFHQKVGGILLIIGALLFPPMVAVAGEDISTLRSQAIKGDANAQYKLGKHYFFGIGVPVDYTKAFYWSRLSANQGNAFGENNLGAMYSKGWGVLKSNAQAIHWYRLAANQGNALAEFNLGVMYNNGWGVSKDVGVALDWIRSSALHGYAPAEWTWGWDNENGIGMQKNLDQARHWYKLSAKTGFAPAELALGSLYLKLVTDWVRGDAEPSQAVSKVAPSDVLPLLAKSKKWLTLANGSPDKDVSKQAALSLKSVNALVEKLDPIARDEAVQRYAEKEDAASNIHIPSHCYSKKTLEEEKDLIPQILGYSPGAGPHITSIENMVPDTQRHVYMTTLPVREHFALNCIIKVHWNNGHVEIGQTFNIWHDANGGTKASYYPFVQSIPEWMHAIR